MALFVWALGGLVPGIGSAQPADAASPQAFVIDSTSSTYPFVMRLEGRMTRTGDEIEVKVEGGLIKSNIPAEYEKEGEATSVAIAFGLGKSTDKGWTFINETADEVVSATLGPSESLPVTPHRFVIKGLAGLPLGDKWLAARLTVDQTLPGVPAGLLSSYGCLDVDLLGETTHSRERQRRLAEDYAHFC